MNLDRTADVDGARLVERVGRAVLGLDLRVIEDVRHTQAARGYHRSAVPRRRTIGLDVKVQPVIGRQLEMEFAVDEVAADRKQKWFRRDERARALAFIEGLRRALHLDPGCTLDRAVALFVETEDYGHRVVVDAALRVLAQRAAPLARGKVGA